MVAQHKWLLHSCNMFIIIVHVSAHPMQKRKCSCFLNERVHVAVQQLDERLLKCPGLTRYCQLETSLLSGQINDILRQYPELGEVRYLQTQLDICQSLLGVTSTTLTLDGCAQVLRNMVPEMRAMFPNVESLVRLLLVNPASSASAERSFSGLRRLKTYLRSTCDQHRLNNLAICHVD